MIAIVDYGIGNVRSIINAFRKNNVEPILTNDKDTILNALLILKEIPEVYQEDILKRIILKYSYLLK